MSVGMMPGLKIGEANRILPSVGCHDAVADCGRVFPVNRESQGAAMRSPSRKAVAELHCLFIGGETDEASAGGLAIAGQSTTSEGKR